jgi:hypothetical protein
MSNTRAIRHPHKQPRRRRRQVAFCVLLCEVCETPGQGRRYACGMYTCLCRDCWADLAARSAGAHAATERKDAR